KLTLSLKEGLEYLKSKNIKASIIKTEASSGTSFPAVQRESFHLNPISVRLLESEKDLPTKFEVVLLQEGLGNSSDGNYYSKEALESSVPIFEGKKCYANHPSKIEDEARPERDVKDIIGHFENIRVEEDSKDGRAMLKGDLIILPGSSYDW